MNVSAELISLLKTANRVVVLTGAGVSQESGLRTFRDAQTGLWAQYHPEDLATPEAFERNPKLVWDWYAMRRAALKTARPNPGHFALVDMARHISQFTLITQNVDGLHQMAGSTHVLELHGSLRQVRCSACDTRAEEWNESSDDVPLCARCGQRLRPNVVWFGEELPIATIDDARIALENCELFFSIGTSGVVQPASSLALLARQRDAVLVEINNEPTHLTGNVDYALLGKSGEILPALVKSAWG